MPHQRHRAIISCGPSAAPERLTSRPLPDAHDIVDGIGAEPVDRTSACRRRRRPWYRPVWQAWPSHRLAVACDHRSWLAVKRSAKPSISGSLTLTLCEVIIASVMVIGRTILKSDTAIMLSLGSLLPCHPSVFRTLCDYKPALCASHSSWTRWRFNQLRRQRRNSHPSPARPCSSAPARPCTVRLVVIGGTWSVRSHSFRRLPATAPPCGSWRGVASGNCFR